MEKLGAVDIAKVVFNLVGEVEPVGECYEDEKRKKNLKTLTKVIYHLLDKVYDLEHYVLSSEQSRYEIGYDAREFLSSVTDGYEPQYVGVEEDDGKTD